MADEGKRTEVLCTKVTERMALDLLHAATSEDRGISEFLFLLIRKELYGRTVRQEATTSNTLR